MTEFVEVTVAKRRAIHLNGDQIKGGKKGDPGKSFGPGEKILVDRDDLERLYKLGFIVDPHAKKVTAADVEAADMSAYVPGENDIKVTEQTDQAIRKGRG